METIRAYHFVGDTLRDGRPVPADGEWLEHDGDIELCASGLHASIDAFDALQYAPGNTLCLVECSGEIVHGDDKLVCSRRRIVARFDAEQLLFKFAREQALSVINLWDAPQVVREFLETGNEYLRDAAWAAALDAEQLAARDAAWDAARAAVRDAAWAAARDVARDVAQDVARAAACQKFNEAVKAEFDSLLGGI